MGYRRKITAIHRAVQNGGPVESETSPWPIAALKSSQARVGMPPLDVRARFQDYVSTGPPSESDVYTHILLHYLH